MILYLDLLTEDVLQSFFKRKKKNSFVIFAIYYIQRMKVGKLSGEKKLYQEHGRIRAKENLTRKGSHHLPGLWIRLHADNRMDGCQHVTPSGLMEH